MHRRTKRLLLGTAGLAVTLAPGILAASQPVILSDLSTVAKAAELTDIEATGSYKITDREPKNGLYEGIAFRSNVDLSLKVKGRPKSGDTIIIKTEGISLLPATTDKLTIGDKLVGRIDSVEQKEQFPASGNNKATDENIKDTKSKASHLYTYKITFDKGIEEFSDPTIELHTKNVYSEGRKSVSIPGGVPYTVSVSVGGKPVFKDDLKFEGYKLKDRVDQTFGVSLGWQVGTILSDGRIQSNQFLAGAVNPGLNDGSESFKAGDLITIKQVDQKDVGLMFLADRVKVGQEFLTSETFNNANAVSHKWSTNTGRLLDTDNQTRLKIVKAGPGEVVFEIVTPGAPGTIGNFGWALQYKLLSNKGVDYEKMLGTPTKFEETWTRGGKVIIKQDKVFTPRFEVVRIGAEGQKIKRGSVLVNLVDSESGEFIDIPKVVSDQSVVGEDYSVDPNNYKVPGYTYKGLRDGSAALKGKVTEGTQTVVLEFVKDAEKPEDEEIVTSFLEEGSGEKLKDPVKAEKEAEPGMIDGYQFVRTERKENEVTHWFKKKEESKKPETKQPNTRYVDEDGRTIEEVPGSQDKKEIPGYTYLRTEKDKDGNLTHVYHKIVSRFVTDKGMTLKQMDGAQPKEDISGYEFVETKTDEKTGDVTHVYREVVPTTEPFTILKDDKGNVLKTTKGTHDPEDLPGYRYLRTEKDRDGNTVHIYHRIVTSFVTSKDGKEVLLKTKDGAQPKEEIEGYEFVETKTDDKLGDIKHFYKVKVVAGAEKKAPVQTAGSAGMMILPAAAVLGLGGLVAGLARRKKD